MSQFPHIDKLSEWIAVTDIDALELEGPDTNVRLVRRGKADVRVQAGPQHRSQTITAESPGIFLHRHPLRTTSFVTPGEAVALGQPVGLLKVGPLLLPIRSPQAGRIEGFWAADGATVGYGTALIELIESQT